MIARYTRPAMGRIWTEENKYRMWLEVEATASEVLAEAGTEPGVIVADIDPAAVTDARQRVPNLQHDRDFQGP